MNGVKYFALDAVTELDAWLRVLPICEGIAAFRVSIAIIEHPKTWRGVWKEQVFKLEYEMAHDAAEEVA